MHIARRSRTAAAGTCVFAAIAACGAGKPAPAPVGPFANAPRPSLSRAATAPPTSVAGSLVELGPYRLVRPPLAVTLDYPPPASRADAVVFVRLNRDLDFGAPQFAMDELGLAANSAGFSDNRQGHCYEALLNTGTLPAGYNVGRVVTVSLRIRARPRDRAPGGYIKVRTPLRPALALTSKTEAGPDSQPDPYEPYFRLLGCSRSR